VLHRPHARVEVEHLAEGDVEAADPAPDRRGERALDGNEVLLDRLGRLLGEVQLLPLVGGDGLDLILG